MTRFPLLADVLSRYVEQRGYTSGQLSMLTGIPKATLINWLNGRVRKPRRLNDLLKVAHVLHLDTVEASRLLSICGYSSIEKLVAMPVSHEQRKLLAPWAKSLGRPKVRMPFQTIADLPYFVGREQEIEALERTLLSGEQGIIYGIQGMVGVGKTALAAHAAYRLRPCFPDGILWARLDGADTTSILSTFAKAYGYDVMEYKDLGSRSRAVRNLLADKRALMVLDNVRSSEEIQPLLPPSGPCVVMITTRRQDLTISWGTHRLNLKPFDKQKGEALSLFARFLADEFYEHDTVFLTQLADLLGHLPLAVAIAASQLAFKRGLSAQDLIQRIQKTQNRLDELVVESRSVRLAFDRIYNTLTTEQRRLFVALGVFADTDFSVEAVADALEMAFEDAHDQLRDLFNLSLIQEGREGRYRLHPLLQDYAREKIDG
jgi:transcriptional regulator with XRE-family HTH domain